MKHLSDDSLLEVLDGAGSSDDLRHIEDCAPCRAGLDSWRGLVDDLRFVSDNAIEPDEVHRLRAQYRAFGPLREGCLEWLGRLLRTTAMRPATVRGGTSPLLQEHEAGPFNVALQVRATAAGSEVAIHGQVFHDELDAEGGEIVISEERGALVTGEIDELGEFSVHVPAWGRYRAILLLPSARIVIEEVEVESGEHG